MSIFNGNDKFYAFYSWASIAARLRLDEKWDTSWDLAAKTRPHRMAFLEGILWSVAMLVGDASAWGHRHELQL